MNSKEVFNYIFNSFNDNRVDYAILHSYQKLPEQFDSDIDTVIRADRIEDAIDLLDRTLSGTGWSIVQYWRHENYAADCVISNDREFLQVDFCTHYERNGRVVLRVDELLENRRYIKNFYIPSREMEFVYILVKKVLKGKFSDGSKEQLTELWKQMPDDEKSRVSSRLQEFFSTNEIAGTIKHIEKAEYEQINILELRKKMISKTFSVVSSLHYRLFDLKRRINRIQHPTGLFVVLLGVDGSGKTTISSEFESRYVTAFRKIQHYHSRVRVLKDISQIGHNDTVIDASNPHSKEKIANKPASLIKFGYYFLDYLIGNVKITIAKVKSTLVVIERYYYDYTIDKVRYNLNLSDGFLKFWGHLVKKPDVIFVLTGDEQVLYERKKEIPVEDILLQKVRLEDSFKNNSKTVFIDTTTNSVEECVNQMLRDCNRVMRENRKW